MRTVKSKDGRTGFPDVVWYRIKDKNGKKSKRRKTVPPTTKSYFIDVLDLDAYEKLCATGRIRESYPTTGELIDNRNTS